MSWSNTWHFSSMRNCTPSGRAARLGEELPAPRHTLWLISALWRGVRDSGLHPAAWGRLHQPLVSFCTIYNSQRFIFILASPALAATRGGFQATWLAAQRAALWLVARLPQSSPYSSPEMPYPAVKHEGWQESTRALAVADTREFR